MKLVFLFLLSCSLLYSCNRRYNEPLNNQVSEYIRKSCQENKPCKIQLKDATDFSWDKFYFFNEAVEDNEIGRIVGINFSSRFTSRKWFFLKDNQLVRSEEQILYEVDLPMKTGDVDFDYDENKFAVFQADSIFELETSKTETGVYYRLHCINCK